MAIRKYPEPAQSSHDGSIVASLRAVGVAALASAHSALLVQEATHLLVVSQTSPLEQFGVVLH